MLSYGPLITSAVAGQQLHGSVSIGNALDSAHRDGLEAMPTPQKLHSEPIKERAHHSVHSSHLTSSYLTSSQLTLFYPN